MVRDHVRDGHRGACGIQFVLILSGPNSQSFPTTDSSDQQQSNCSPPTVSCGLRDGVNPRRKSFPWTSTPAFQRLIIAAACAWLPTSSDLSTCASALEPLSFSLIFQCLGYLYWPSPSPNYVLIPIINPYFIYSQWFCFPECTSMKHSLSNNPRQQRMPCTPPVSLQNSPPNANPRSLHLIGRISFVFAFKQIRKSGHGWVCLIF